MRVSKFAIVNIFFLLLAAHLAADVYFNDVSYWWLGLVALVYICIILLGCIFIQWNFFLVSRNRLPFLQIKRQQAQMAFHTDMKRVALTFDDGPSPTTGAVLDILKNEKVPAAFFIIGKHIPGRESLLLRMQAEGHLIGNHSFGHGFNFDWKRTKMMMQEIDQTNEAIKKITGEAPLFFRPPYGVTNPNVARAVRRMGMTSIGWNIRSKDTVATDEEKLLKKIVGGLKGRDIILLHDRCDITVRILPDLIRRLRELGYIFVLPS